MNQKKRTVEDEKRRYNADWEEKYFIVPKESKLICLICGEILSIFKEFNVRRYFLKRHIKIANMSEEEKRIELDELKSQVKYRKSLLSSFMNKQPLISKASYSVALLIARKMKPFSDGEFIKECLIAVIKDIMPEKLSLFNNVSLSRRTICRRIDDISAEIETSLQVHIQKFKSFSLAFDESTDVSDTSQLVVYIRGVNDSFQLTEEMLNLLPLKGSTRGQDIFNLIMQCLLDNKLDLKMLSGLTTDGAPAFIDKNKGVVKLILEHLSSKNIDTNNIFEIYCLIYQQNLCDQVLSMNHVMSVVVNYIRSHALQHRQFKALLEELSAEYGDLAYFQVLDG